MRHNLQARARPRDPGRQPRRHSPDRAQPPRRRTHEQAEQPHREPPACGAPRPFPQAEPEPVASRAIPARRRRARGGQSRSCPLSSRRPGPAAIPTRQEATRLIHKPPTQLGRSPCPHPASQTPHANRAHCHGVVDGERCRRASASSVCHDAGFAANTTRKSSRSSSGSSAHSCIT